MVCTMDVLKKKFQCMYTCIWYNKRVNIFFDTSTITMAFPQTRVKTYPNNFSDCVIQGACD